MEYFTYKQMIEDSPIAYASGKIIKDEDGKIKELEVTTINKSFEELFKIKPKDIIGKEILRWTGKNGIIEWLDLLDKITQNEKYSVEKYIKEINLNCKIDFYNCGDDNIYIRFNKIGDLSLKLPPSIRRAPFVSWIKDTQGKYLDVNEKFLEMENVEYEDIIGKTSHYTTNKEAADRYENQDKEVIRENKMHTYKSIQPGKDKTRYYEVTKWPNIDTNMNVVVGTIGIAIETTDEIELIKEMEENQEILYQITNNIEEIISIKDKEKFIYVSPTFEKIYGVKPEELNLYEDNTGWYEYWDRLETEKKMEEFDFKGTSTGIVKVTKSNQEKWLYSKEVPLFDEDGNVIRKVGITTDLTNTKRVEAEIENLRMDFFANLSHELRTPITLILSSLQVLNLKKYKLEENDFIYFNKYSSIIKQNGLRLLKLVNNLIDTTKLDANHFNHTPQNSDIISCVENICMSVSEFADANKLNLIFDTDSEEKIISFDQDNIERVILNLLSNAIKFSKPNGNIEVNINCENDIKIIVKDDGIGIPKDKLERIFGRFEQVKSKIKNEKEGSGIGLYLVKSLVEMHGGDISLKSELGQGSEFIITLPDVLTTENDNSILQECKGFSNISKMNVEFSDIYT